MENTKEIEGKGWAVTCHLSAWVGYLGIPFGNILGPLVVWLLMKEAYPIANAHGKEAINFQISWTIYLIGMIALFILSLGFLWFFLIPILLIWLIAKITLVICAAVQASNGNPYRYPLTIRFLQ